MLTTAWAKVKLWLAVPHALVSIANVVSDHKLSTLLTWMALWVWAVATDQFPPGAIAAVLALMIADFVLGTVRTWHERRWRLTGMWQGVLKFLVYLSVIALVNHLARVEIGQAWETLTDLLIAAVVAMMLLTEAISLLTHLQALAGRDIPVLGWIMRRLEAERSKLEPPADGGPPA